MNRITGIVAYPGGKVRPRRALMTPPGAMGDMLRLLADAAEAGLPCPSGADLADKLGYPDGRSALQVLNKLEDGGWISVDRRAARQLVVTVTDTGKSTKPTSTVKRMGTAMRGGAR